MKPEIWTDLYARTIALLKYGSIHTKIIFIRCLVPVVTHLAGFVFGRNGPSTLREA